ncbi:cell surface protein [Pseudoalteromonas sp. Z9A5]|uniref:cell surface protein n=1 Tax=Pseudoalteromonas sp. Z9A5 TaxID=2686355 RepID=UPI001407B3ED|nr:cell surface protein [Pseudoalteromonas sp. Z9A5]
MITLLTRLTLCFALLSSFNSAAYNSAMCILIKQEMQQYSNNKTSAKYRSAARDYSKNCNKPVEVKTQPKPEIVEPKPIIITQPQPQIVEPAPIPEIDSTLTTDTTQATNQPTDAAINLTDDQKQQVTEQLNAVNIQTSTENTELNTPSVKSDDALSEQVNKPVKTQSTPIENIAPAPKPAVKSAPVYTPAPAPIAESPSSLLLPTLILVIVVLIGAMVIVRLRRAKKNKDTSPPATTVPIKPTTAAPDANSSATSNAKVSVVNLQKDKAPIKPEPIKPEPIKSDPVIQSAPLNTHTDKPETEQAPAEPVITPVTQTVHVTDEPTDAKKTLLNNDVTQNVEVENVEAKAEHVVTTAVAKNQIDEIEPESQIATTEQKSIEEQTNALDKTSDATFTKTKQKPEPNTAEFEAAAKTTLQRIKSASDFNEPEVRKFDPEALPVKKQRKQHIAPVVEPVITDPEPVTPDEPIVDLHSPDDASAQQTTSFNSEYDFKEPEVRVFDPEAPLPGEKVKPTPAAKPIAKPVAQSTSTEPTGTDPTPAEQVETKIEETPKTAEPAKVGNSNPFANLSLDSSWDPESTEKPVIEEKKRAPKSQALIDAEERAKNMQTKE